MKDITTVILAAGKGSRLNSLSVNKVTRKIGGKPLILHTLDLLKRLKIDNIITVVGFKKGSVQKTLGNNSIYAVQSKPLGTADAVKKALPFIKTKTTLVLNGDDSAFYSVEDIKQLIQKHFQEKADMTLLTAIKANPGRLGRVVRDSDQKIIKIVEAVNASKSERAIKEINTATYCFKTNLLKQFLPLIDLNPVSGEFYLTDILEIAVNNHSSITSIQLNNSNHFHGVNTKKELQLADRKMKQKMP